MHWTLVTKEIVTLNPVTDCAKVASRLNINIFICRVLEDNFGLPEEESSREKSIASLSLLKTDYRP